MRIVATYYTHYGDRDSNEDALLIDQKLIQAQKLEISTHKLESDKALFAVADGMGGESQGEEASYWVLHQLLSEYESLSNEESVITTIQNAKKRLDSEVSKNSSLLNFGSTIAGVLFKDTKAIIFNSGDSRVYRLSGKFLEQLTHDHSYVQNLVDDGLLEINQMSENPYKNILTSAIVGDLSDTQPRIETKSIELRESEIFLICSDGVWEGMSLEVMETCFKQECVVECLIDKVNLSKERDNFSLIVVEVH